MKAHFRIHPSLRPAIFREVKALGKQGFQTVASGKMAFTENNRESNWEGNSCSWLRVMSWLISHIFCPFNCSSLTWWNSIWYLSIPRSRDHCEFQVSCQLWSSATHWTWKTKTYSLSKNFPLIIKWSKSYPGTVTSTIIWYVAKLFGHKLFLFPWPNYKVSLRYWPLGTFVITVIFVYLCKMHTHTHTILPPTTTPTRIFV